eukprot:TRINITY_DN12010_c2_g1_i1.p2 TRINITY_DN12010_c2_g1~~TRINITY_DN12010_c2_g1_i1.p2  ORF type:complete len:253 (+),score=46.81 TRINITY_DN12010_c2_g1_i1:79-759(+)
MKSIIVPPVDPADAKKAKKKGKGGQAESPEVPEQWDGSIQMLQTLLQKVREVDEGQHNGINSELSFTLDGCITPQNESLINQRIFGDILLEVVDQLPDIADQIKEECIQREEERKHANVEGEETQVEEKVQKSKGGKGAKDVTNEPKFNPDEYKQEFNKSISQILGKCVDEVKERVGVNKNKIRQHLDRQIVDLQSQIDSKNDQDQVVDKLWQVFDLLRTMELLKL